jgi:superoxide dismutase, Cu-Zn family
MRVLILSAALATTLAGCAAAADNKTANMTKIDKNGTGEAVGTVTLSGGSSGLVLTTDLKGLPPGEHGFHLHEKGECGPGPNPQGEIIPCGAAGGHWSPSGSKAHAGPAGDGHMGDLPFLTLESDGTSKEQLIAPRITDLGQLDGHALMIHAGGDNYADQPQPLGGGGGRIACGVVK